MSHTIVDVWLRQSLWCFSSKQTKKSVFYFSELTSFDSWTAQRVQSIERWHRCFCSFSLSLSPSQLKLFGRSVYVIASDETSIYRWPHWFQCNQSRAKLRNRLLWCDYQQRICATFFLNASIEINVKKRSIFFLKIKIWIYSLVKIMAIILGTICTWSRLIPRHIFELETEH